MKTLDELKENLKEIYDDLNAGEIQRVCRRGEIVM